MPAHKLWKKDRERLQTVQKVRDRAFTVDLCLFGKLSSWLIFNFLSNLIASVFRWFRVHCFVLIRGLKSCFNLHTVWFRCENAERNSWFPKWNSSEAGENPAIWLAKELSEKNRQMKSFGHLIRGDGLQRLLLEGKFNGKRGRGRPRFTWFSNIKEWTGMNYAEAIRKAQHREDWASMAANLLRAEGTWRRRKVDAISTFRTAKFSMRRSETFDCACVVVNFYDDRLDNRYFCCR